MIIKRETLKTALHATDKDGDRRYFMSVVRVLPSGVVEATDGTILVRVSDPYPHAVEDFPIVPGAENLNGMETGTLIPTEIVDKLIKGTAKKPTIPILSAIRVGEQDGRKYAIATDLTVPVVVCLDNANSKDAGPFPKTDHVMGQDGERGPVIKLTLSAAMLARLAAIARDAGRLKSNNTLTLEIPTDEKYRETRKDAGGDTVAGDSIMSSVRFTTGSECRVDGVVMPCRQ